jgi:hypothetical protein
MLFLEFSSVLHVVLFIQYMRTNVEAVLTDLVQIIDNLFEEGKTICRPW